MTVHRRRILGVAAAALLAALLATHVQTTAEAQQRDVDDAAQADAESDPFAASRVRVSVVGGVTSSRTDTYLRLGAGLGYYLVDGLEVGLGTDLWFLGDPTFLNVSPGLVYAFPLRSELRPYVGSFYRHAFVFGEEDLDSIGGRAGLYFTRGRAYVGAGAVYEHWLGCDSGTFVDCDALYPEVALAVAF